MLAADMSGDHAFDEIFFLISTYGRCGDFVSDGPVRRYRRGITF